jgi:hypothetical protein
LLTGGSADKTRGLVLAESSPEACWRVFDSLARYVKMISFIVVAQVDLNKLREASFDLLGLLTIHEGDMERVH